VLGQPNFTSSVHAATQSGMYKPIGVFVDAGGRLWCQNRTITGVLRFDNAASKANGANANGVLGQPTFTSSAHATTQSGMYTPKESSGTQSGHLWVTEWSNNRVLRFDNAATKANGANADGVLGQPNFTTNSSATTQSGMKTPSGVSGG